MNLKTKTDSPALCRLTDRPAVAWLSLGSNLGDRLRWLRFARSSLAEHRAIGLCAYSSVYRTDPVGPGVQRDYFNAVVRVRTCLTASGLLSVCQAIERQAGRRRTVRWAARTLDLDLLLFDRLQQSDPNCLLPHPRMHERWFVLQPLTEVYDSSMSLPGGRLGVARLLAGLAVGGRLLRRFW